MIPFNKPLNSSSSSQSNIFNLTLTQIIQLLRRKELSSQELTRAYINRIEFLQQNLNSFITITPELALSQASFADQRLTATQGHAGETLSLLCGVPIAIKDILCVEGVRCTCGSRILENFKPVYDATVVRKLRDSGMVFLGKTNTDEFAMGSSTENSAYGVTHNPWNLQRVPTGGSVRQPASFCGLTGIKPTYGRISRYGLIAYGSSLDVVGVIGHNAADVALVYASIAGHDPLDSTSTDHPAPHLTLTDPPEKTFRDLRIGVPEEYFISGIQDEVESAVMESIRIIERLGAQTRSISLPHTKYAVPVYYLIAPAEASANLARYDGIRYGSRQTAESVWDIFRKTRGEMFGSEVKRRIMLGTYALSAGYYDAYYGQAQKVRTLIKNDFEKAFEIVDLIAAPVTPTTAFRIGEHTDDPLSMYLEDAFTLPANLSGIPGLAFPVGFDKSGLPIGMQLMAPHFQEPLLFQVAHAFQQVTDWHTYMPLPDTI
jgi:aspartyl-tRNA(Asn)/glutamyl-tRNA(Gln) amidotransferase subunit A